MSEVKTKRLKRQVLLNETDPLPVADVDMTIDGRYITEEEFAEMVETFDPNKLKVGWYIGHIYNFWMEKDKEPEKQGIIRDIEFKDGVLYVYSQDLDKEFVKAIRQGKYTDLSIEAMRIPIENKTPLEEEETEQEYKWHLTGIAAVKTGAFSRYGLVEYETYSGTTAYKHLIINQPCFFNSEKNLSEVEMAKTKTKDKNEDQLDIIYAPKDGPITTTIDESTSKEEAVSSAYLDNLQIAEMKAREDVIYLEAKIKTLKNKLEDKNLEIDELKKIIPEKDKTILERDFTIFYLKGLKEEKLQNKFLGFDEDVNILDIKLEDIFRSKMWRDYSTNEHLRESIEKQLEMGFFVEKVGNTQYGNTPTTNEEPDQKRNYDDNDLYEYAKKLCIKETGKWTSNDLNKYLKKAQREINRKNY